jgi:Uma2 family endonuclease
MSQSIAIPATEPKKTVKKAKKGIKFPQPKLLTFKDYERLTPPDSGNYELHNGKIIYMASPLAPHQIVSGNLHAAIHFHIRQNKLGVVLTAPMDTILTPNDTVQPDLLFISNDRLHIIDRQVKGAPDFIVEILSGSNNPKEMSYKKYLYETTGVREYWIVNIEKQLVTQYENREGEFFIQHIAKREDVLTSLVIDGFQIDVNDILP